MFAKRLRELRKEFGLTQRELGEKVGVSQRVLGYYETENRFPDDQKPFFRGVQMILLSVALVFVFAVSIWNAAGLRVGFLEEP